LIKENAKSRLRKTPRSLKDNGTTLVLWCIFPLIVSKPFALLTVLVDMFWLEAVLIPSFYADRLLARIDVHLPVLWLLA
jgi:hypothetical protein